MASYYLGLGPNKVRSSHGGTKLGNKSGVRHGRRCSSSRCSGSAADDGYVRRVVASSLASRRAWRRSGGRCRSAPGAPWRPPRISSWTAASATTTLLLVLVYSCCCCCCCWRRWPSSSGWAPRRRRRPWPWPWRAACRICSAPCWTASTCRPRRRTTTNPSLCLTCWGMCSALRCLCSGASLYIYINREKETDGGSRFLIW